NVADEFWFGTARANGPADGKVDMLSCAKHEFGHALGYFFDSNSARFAPYKADVAPDANGDRWITLNDFGNLKMPIGLANDGKRREYMTGGNVASTYIAIARLLMDASPMNNGERTIMSTYDIAAIGQVSGLPANNGDYVLVGKGQVVPEPATFALLGLA